MTSRQAMVNVHLKHRLKEFVVKFLQGMEHFVLCLSVCLSVCMSVSLCAFLAKLSKLYFKKI
jgi:hypothetical protein